jgi:GNAT superfamily N-acetyltransferase
MEPALPLLRRSVNHYPTVIERCPYMPGEDIGGYQRRDHAELGEFIGRIVHELEEYGQDGRASDLEAAQKAFRAFRLELEQHLLSEEDEIFPAWKKAHPEDAQKIAGFSRAHVEIRTATARLDQALNLPRGQMRARTALARVEDLKRVILPHEAAEEKLWPAEKSPVSKKAGSTLRGEAPRGLTPETLAAMVYDTGMGLDDGQGFTLTVHGQTGQIRLRFTRAIGLSFGKVGATGYFVDADLGDGEFTPIATYSSAEPLRGWVFKLNQKWKNSDAGKRHKAVGAWLEAVVNQLPERVGTLAKRTVVTAEEPRNVAPRGPRTGKTTVERLPVSHSKEGLHHVYAGVLAYARKVATAQDRVVETKVNPGDQVRIDRTISVSQRSPGSDPFVEVFLRFRTNTVQVMPMHADLGSEHVRLDAGLSPEQATAQVNAWLSYFLDRAPGFALDSEKTRAALRAKLQLEGAAVNDRELTKVERLRTPVKASTPRGRQLIYENALAHAKSVAQAQSREVHAFQNRGRGHIELTYPRSYGFSGASIEVNVDSKAASIRPETVGILTEFVSLADASVEAVVAQVNAWVDHFSRKTPGWTRSLPQAREAAQARSRAGGPGQAPVVERMPVKRSASPSKPRASAPGSRKAGGKTPVGGQRGPDGMLSPAARRAWAAFLKKGEKIRDSGYLDQYPGTASLLEAFLLMVRGKLYPNEQNSDENWAEAREKLAQARETWPDLPQSDDWLVETRVSLLVAYLFETYNAELNQRGLRQDQIRKLHRDFSSRVAEVLRKADPTRGRPGSLVTSEPRGRSEQPGPRGLPSVVKQRDVAAAQRGETWSEYHNRYIPFEDAAVNPTQYRQHIYRSLGLDSQGQLSEPVEDFVARMAPRPALRKDDYVDVRVDVTQAADYPDDVPLFFAAAVDARGTEIGVDKEQAPVNLTAYVGTSAQVQGMLRKQAREVSTTPIADEAAPVKKSAKVAFLEELTVAPDYQKRGLARRAYDLLVERLHDWGARQVYLIAAPGSALSFWQHLGFTKLVWYAGTDHDGGRYHLLVKDL